MSINRSVNKAILLAMGLPLVFCFDQAVARRAYSTAEAEVGRYGGEMPVSSAPVRVHKRPKKRIARATKTPKQAPAGFFAEAAKMDPKAAAAVEQFDKEVKGTAPDEQSAPASTTAVTNLAPATAATGSATIIPVSSNLTADQLSQVSQAKNLTDSGQYAAANKICDELLKASPDSASVLLQKAEILARCKNYGQARQLVERVSRSKLVDARSSGDLSQLALLYYLLEDNNAAAATIQDALRIAPLDNAIMVRAIDYLGANGQYEQALQVTQEILNQRKDSALSHALALMQARTGHISDAMATIARQFDDSNSAEMQEVQAEAYMAAAQYGKALAIYTSLAREHRQEVFYPSSKAEMLRKLGRYQEALVECNAALQLTSQDPWLLSCKVKILQELKQFDAAHKAVKELIAVSPNDPLNYIASANVYEAQRDFGSALIACDEGLRRLGSSDELKEQRVRELWNLGRLDSAASELDKLIAQEPDNDQFKRLKLRFETFRGNFDQAQKIAQALTASSGGTSATQLCLAEYNFAKKDYKQALSALDAALKHTALTDLQRTPMQLLAVASCMLSGQSGLALERLDEYYQEADASVEGGWPCPLLQVMMGKISMPMVISKTSDVDKFATISFFEAVRLLAKDDKVHATRMFAQAAREERSDSMESVAGCTLQQSGLSSQMINMLLIALGSVAALALLVGMVILVKKLIAKNAAKPIGDRDPEGFLQESDQTKAWTPNEVAGGARPNQQDNSRVSAISEQLPNASELSPDSSGARRKYFASFSSDAQVEDIWNKRISNLDANGNPLTQRYELKDDIVSYGASLPPIIPGVAQNDAYKGEPDVKNEDESH